MKTKNYTHIDLSIADQFPIDSVSIILDSSSKFRNQLASRNIIESNFIDLITFNEPSLLVPYLNIAQNISLTEQSNNKKEKNVISKFIYGHHFDHFLPNFMEKKTTCLSQLEKTTVLLFRATSKGKSMIILENLIDDFSIIETRFFIDLVTELAFQLNLRIIITTNQPELLAQPQVNAFNTSSIAK